MVDAIREDRDSVLTGEDVPTEGFPQQWCWASSGAIAPRR